jgi:hypothetical protein
LRSWLAKNMTVDFMISRTLAIWMSGANDRYVCAGRAAGEHAGPPGAYVPIIAPTTAIFSDN